jgi:membrane-associated phospholipid phosphatase
LFIVGILTGVVLKFVVLRPQPFEVLSGIVVRVPAIADSSIPSFPSGQTLIVSIGAFFALTKFRRVSLKLLLGGEAALVCYSLVFVGVHWVTDVIAGILLATAVVPIGEAIFKRYLGAFIRRIADVLARILGNGILTV